MKDPQRIEMLFNGVRWGRVWVHTMVVAVVERLHDHGTADLHVGLAPQQLLRGSTQPCRSLPPPAAAHQVRHPSDLAMEPAGAHRGDVEVGRTTPLPVVRKGLLIAAPYVEVAVQPHPGATREFCMVR